MNDPVANYDRIAEIYDADMGASMDLPDIDFYLRAARRIGGPVLELGCGNGRILAPLLAAGIEAVGVDASTGMLKQARLRLGVNAPVLQMDLRQLDLPPGHFALALLPYSLITYLTTTQAWRDLASGLRRCMRSGACVLLDAFIPRPLATDGNWKRDYARQTNRKWLVRHKRIRALPDQCHHIERRYRLHGQFGGRTLVTAEHIRPYTPAELRSFAERYLGEVFEVSNDYEQLDCSAEPRFISMWVRLRVPDYVQFDSQG